MKNGVPTVCSPVPNTHTCQRPYHDANDTNYAGPHGDRDFIADFNGGAMNGFVSQAAKVLAATVAFCAPRPKVGSCQNTTHPIDVMGYHDAREIPNYWAYARHFVLQDHMFAPSSSWSLVEHLDIVSAWSAKCSKKGDPLSCKNNIHAPATPPDFRVFGLGPEFVPKGQ